MEQPLEKKLTNRQIMLDTNKVVRVTMPHASRLTLRLHSGHRACFDSASQHKSHYTLDNSDQTSEVFGNLGGLKYLESLVFRFLLFKGRIEEGMGFV